MAQRVDANWRGGSTPLSGSPGDRFDDAAVEALLATPERAPAARIHGRITRPTGKPAAPGVLGDIEGFVDS